MNRLLVIVFFLLPFMQSHGDEYPQGIEEITYLSSADDSEQPALWWAPPGTGDTSVPLLVALHTWSGDYRQGGSQVPLAQWCQQEKWAFVHPNFRGQNWTPEALGSELVVADIVSAVEFAKSETQIDESRIYCIGVSGGGHASMLMAARAPEIWAGVSAWCGISDIARWHEQTRGNEFSRYADHIEKALGGTPREHRDEARRRSPNFWLKKNREQLPPLDLWHGIHDGRTGSVPFTHSLYAWNAAVGDRKLTGQYIEQSSKLMKFVEVDPPEYGSVGDREIHFQRSEGNVRVSIFEGGHEILQEPALNWLATQRKGKSALWNIGDTKVIRDRLPKTTSGK